MKKKFTIQLFTACGINTSYKRLTHLFVYLKEMEDTVPGLAGADVRYLAVLELDKEDDIVTVQNLHMAAKNARGAQ